MIEIKKEPRSTLIFRVQTVVFLLVNDGNFVLAVPVLSVVFLLPFSDQYQEYVQQSVLQSDIPAFLFLLGDTLYKPVSFP